MKSNSPPTIRCESGAGVAIGIAALDIARAGIDGGGTADNDGVGAAVGLD